MGHIIVDFLQKLLSATRVAGYLMVGFTDDLDGNRGFTVSSNINTSSNTNALIIIFVFIPIVIYWTFVLFSCEYFHVT